MLVIVNVDQIKCHFLLFNCKNFCSFIKYLFFYVSGFSKSAKQRKCKNCQKVYLNFYIAGPSLLIIFLIPLFNKIKQAKEISTPYNNIKNKNFFSINILAKQGSTRNNFWDPNFPTLLLKTFRFTGIIQFSCLFYCSTISEKILWKS